MKYAIKYYRGCPILGKADEIIIKYNEKTTALLDFVQKWKPKQRIVLDIKENEDILQSRLILRQAKELHAQIALLLSKEQFNEDIDTLNIPYFFAEGANTYDELHGQLAAGVSDIYIKDELGFNLSKISEYLHNNGIKVRVFPNVAQTSTTLPADPMKNFFVRPNAILVYEDMIDVCEFYAPLDKQAVLFDIYRDQRWLGNLREVIYGLDVDVDNQTLLPHFDLSRGKCGKRCNMGKCDICNVAVSVGKTLDDKGIKFRKKKAEYNEEAEDIKNESEIDEKVSESK